VAVTPPESPCIDCTLCGTGQKLVAPLLVYPLSQTYILYICSRVNHSTSNRLTWFLTKGPLIKRIGILGNICWLLVSMDTPIDSTATCWFPRIYIYHFRIPGNVFRNELVLHGNVFVNAFPRNGSTSHYILRLQIQFGRKKNFRLQNCLLRQSKFFSPDCFDIQIK
jgi:hypothetical protein